MSKVSSQRLFQLISPSLPIGSFTYSQGIEWAFETGWINDAASLEEWLDDLIQTAVKQFELPVLIRLMTAWQNDDKKAIHYWNQYLMASRESAELKLEESNRGRALADIIQSLQPYDASIKPLIAANQTSGFAYATMQWEIDQQAACEGFVWAWLENLVLAAVKIIPLGQTQGQQVLFSLSEKVSEIYQQSLEVADDDIGYSSTAMAIASAQHETQYTRLYRS